MSSTLISTLRRASPSSLKISNLGSPKRFSRTKASHRQYISMSRTTLPLESLPVEGSSSTTKRELSVRLALISQASLETFWIEVGPKQPVESLSNFLRNSRLASSSVIDNILTHIERLPAGPKQNPLGDFPESSTVSNA